jgi:ribosomal-protein-alanine N-acetyltransferase
VRIIEIQASSPGAATWARRDYLEAIGPHADCECWVAEKGQRILGFLLWRRTGPQEAEVLNLAVDPSSRRRGIASALLRELQAVTAGELFLELRSSNHVALQLYGSLGFCAVGRRRGYYREPAEDALIMRYAANP